MSNINKLLVIQNVSELEKHAKQELEKYVPVKVTEENYKDVKKERAATVKLSKELNTERKRAASVIKKQVDAIMAKVDARTAEIDETLATYETSVEDKTILALIELYDSFKLDIPFELVFEQSWLNITVDYEKALREKVVRIKKDLAMMDTLAVPSRIKELYLDSLDIETAKAEYDAENETETENETTTDIISEHLIEFVSDDETYNKVLELVSDMVTVIYTK